MKRDYYRYAIRSRNSNYRHDLLMTSVKAPGGECQIHVIDNGITDHIDSASVVVLSHGYGVHGNEVCSLINGRTRGILPNRSDVYFHGIGENKNQEISTAFKRVLGFLDEFHGVIVLLIAWETDDVTEDAYNLYIEILKTNRVVVVCAAGNSGSGAIPLFPACVAHSRSITVGSHDMYNCISLFTTKSESFLPKVYAPGRKIFTVNGVNYGYTSGTSYSAAITAACVSLYCGTDADETVHEFYKNCNKNAVAFKQEDHVYNTYYHEILTPYIGSDRDAMRNELVFTVGDIGWFNGNIFTKDLHSGKVSDLTDLMVDVWMQQKSPVLMLSGGLDSLFIYERLCSRLGTIPTVTFAMYYQDLCINYQDVSQAYRTNPNTILYNIDMSYFFDTHVVDLYKRRYYTESYQIAAHLYMVDQLPAEYTPVFSGDLIYDYETVPDRKFAAYDFYAYYNARPMVTRMLWHNVDIARTVVETSKDAVGSIDQYECKLNFYRHHGYRGAVPTVGKLTGFECLKLAYADMYKAHRIFDALYRG